MQSVITLANEHWAQRPELWSTDEAGADAPAFSYAVDSDPETTPTQSYTIMDTVIDPETGVNIACIVDTGCGPPSIIEKRCREMSMLQPTQSRENIQNSGLSFDFLVYSKIAYEIRGSRKSQVEKIFRIQE